MNNVMTKEQMALRQIHRRLLAIEQDYNISTKERALEIVSTWRDSRVVTAAAQFLVLDEILNVIKDLPHVDDLLFDIFSTPGENTSYDDTFEYFDKAKSR